MVPRLPPLPVLQSLPELRDSLAACGRAVLSAPPGSGKTTLVPLALLDEPWLQNRKIIVLEPRRVAARAAAARMAALLGENVGDTVGYQIRFERRISSRTRIEVLTEGLLTRRLQHDPELPGVGLVIFDEFHERSLDADLALALSLDVSATLSPELRLLVMSATLDTDRVAALLNHAPIISAQGRQYEVNVQHLSVSADQEHGEAVARACLTAVEQTSGDVLAFLPGAREIRNAQNLLQQRLGASFAVRPLMGELSSSDQDLALQPDGEGRRKIILATNIAQTSLTVEGVHTVVDGGLVRVARFDLGAGADRLETQRVSRASAEQRAGRAGRLGPGVCYRLWNRDQHASLAAHDTPEILAVDLTRFALELAAWGVREPHQLALLDMPASASWQYALARLQELEALDASGRITAHGRALMRLPTTPRRAHMLLKSAAAGLGETASWVAAVLEERGAMDSDLVQLIERYRRGAIDPAAKRRVEDNLRQLRRVLDLDNTGRYEDHAVARVLSWAYPERIAFKREGQRTQDAVFLCADGGEARLHERDALAHQTWLAIAHWDPGPPRRIRLAAALPEAQLHQDHAAQLQWQNLVFWDSANAAVTSESQRRLGAIVLERKPWRGQDVIPAVRAAVVRGIRELGLQSLPWKDDDRQWQLRVQALRKWRPELDLPDVSDAQLLASLESWLAPCLDGVSRKEQFSRIDLRVALSSLLNYEQQRALSRYAPTHLEVPTGSNIRLEYREQEAPLLSVKLQEMFGCSSTPTVNEGRQPVVMQLLSPAQRPIAVTQDLAGFWAGSYADVRKDLRGRYPRHPWPEDPLAANPTRRAKPRGT